MKLKFGFLLLFFFTSAVVLAQTIERIPIQGQITAPLGEDVENISIYNVSSQKGTITDKEGLFTIEVALHDRIEVTALQFASFSVNVDAGVIKSRKMKVYLNPSVNVLEDVVINQYDLTGYAELDVKSIKTYVVPNISLSKAEILSTANMAPDQYSAIKGNFAASVISPSANGVSVNILALADLFSKKTATVYKRKPPVDVAKELRERFSPAFIEENFHISSEKADDFLYFVEDHGLLASYLKPENELLLMDFMLQQSSAYLSQNGN